MNFDKVKLRKQQKRIKNKNKRKRKNIKNTLEHFKFTARTGWYTCSPSENVTLLKK